MTENEIREEIKELKRKANIFENSGYATAGISLSFKKSVKVIEELLEELKQYREIGTVQGYERAIQCSLENYNLYKEYKSKVQDYEAIGTRNDFIYFKEQNKYLLKENETQRDLIDKYEAIGTVEDVQEIFSLCKTLQEVVKKYSAIGTVEDIEKSMQNVSVLLAEYEVLKSYQAIGTIEEFKTLKENRFFNFDSSVVRIDEKSYNKAIDEFAERLKDKLQAMADEPAYQHTGEDYFTGICCAETVVDEIAEQLKSDELILENVDLDERE